MENNKYAKIIESTRHVVNNIGPLIIEHNTCIFTIDCVEISMKHIEKAARQFEMYDFEEVIQTTDSSFLLK